jgi:hypothetical protein
MKVNEEPETDLIEIVMEPSDGDMTEKFREAFDRLSGQTPDGPRS